MLDVWQRLSASDPVIPPPEDPDKPKAQDEQPQRGMPTVLVVDDERLIADTTIEILKHAGFRAECAYDGKCGLEAALRLRPDFLITDVVMPIMNGVDLAIEVRRALPGTRIILLSGQAGIGDMLERAREQGCHFELLAKPIHPARLLERVRKK